ncbi:sugar ABC transporter permease [Actinomyces sp. 186855]|nr:sugar ABC transporter permease [Actinomyces sp. AC-20-1]MCL3790107.1 sugar ABC transporter permease [Actinomyces sp. 187325]MCL3792409.1 sugar ABC transporter permease [Actinomyces sp. 186855]MCL3793476.1 sugar ABC transporter permease [Actinomyces sp. 217892]
MTLRARTNIRAYMFMAPALIMLAVFVFLPIIGSIPLVFYDYSMIGSVEFIGWDNFARALNDGTFRIAIVNTITFVAVVPVIQLCSVFLATLVNQRLKGVVFFRTLFYIPVITSMVAVSIIWSFLFDSHGIINTKLMEWGLTEQPLLFHNSSSTAMLCIMFLTLWQGLGYYMMLYLAGLQSIPDEVIEAARTDGANALQVFFRVKVPMLKPYIWFCSLNSVISAVAVFDPIYVMTQGGPNNATMVINYYAYLKAFKEFEFGYSATIGLVQAVITGMLSVLVFVYGRRNGGMTYGK